MPLNEALPARSALSKREKHEALAAIYGVPAALPTQDEIDQLRELLAENSD